MPLINIIMLIVSTVVFGIVMYRISKMNKGK